MYPPAGRSFLASLLGCFYLCTGALCGQGAPNLTYDDFMTRLGEAKAKQKPMLLFLVNESSAVSKKIDAEILANPVPELKKSLDAFVLTRVNGATPDGRQVEDAYGWKEPPVMAILNSDGEIFSILDLSKLPEQLINSAMPKELASWLDKSAIRFQRHGARGYDQGEIAAGDPIRGVIADWEKVKGNYKNDRAVFLLDDGRMSFDGTNTVTYRQHSIEYIGKTDTVMHFTIEIPIWKKSATFRLKRARVITPDFKENRIDAEDVEEITGYLDAPQFNYVRTEKILFPATKQGCFLESDWEIVEATQMPGQANMFWSISEEGCPSLRSHAEFSAPDSTAPRAAVIRNSGKIGTNSQNGITTLTFNGRSEHNQSDKDLDDRDLPVKEGVLFATRNSWEEVGKWFLSLFNAPDCLKRTPEFDKWVADALLSVGKGDEYERRAANAILKAMRKNFRYLNVELNDSGAQPHGLAEILKNRCGDCKDLSLFLREALKVAGVESHPVLLDTKSCDPLDQEIPNPSAFNHAILQIETPRGPIYADPASRLVAGVLPPHDCGKKGLLCSEKNTALVSLPPWDEKASSCTLEVQFRSLTKNPTPALWTFSSTGYLKSCLQREFHERWNSIFDKRSSVFLKRHFKDFEVTGSNKSFDNDDPEALQIRLDAKIPGVLQSSEEGISVPVFFLDDQNRFPHRITGRKSDEPAMISDWRVEPLKEIVSYPLPKGFVFTPPPAIHVDNPYFKVDRSYDTNGGKITITTTVVNKAASGPSCYVRESQLPPDSRNIVDRLTRHVVIKKSPGELLRDASASGNRPKVLELLKKGAPVDDKDGDGNTPLIIAASRGRLEIVRDLLAAKADIKARNNDDWDALAKACRLDRTDVALALIDAGADINATNCGDDQVRPVNFAAARGNIPLLTRLLDAGADINANSGEGTPIFLALQYGKMEAAKFLLSRKPNLDLVPLDSKSLDEGYPVASLPGVLVTQGSKDVLKFALENGFKPDSDNTYSSPLKYAAGFGRTDMMELLLKHGAQVDKGDIRGVTPLMNAAWFGWTPSVKFLLEHGAQINKLDTRGLSAISYAAASGKKDCIQCLVDHGAKEEDIRILPPFEKPAITPAQAWALSLAAPYFLQFRHHQLTLGRDPTSDHSVQNERKSLKEVWGIDDHTSLLSTLNDLKSEGHRDSYLAKGRSLASMDETKFQNLINGPLVRDNQREAIKLLRQGYIKWKDRLGLAFDVCRYANLVCWGYRCGYITTEQEAWELLTPIARTAQKNFSSWKEVGENFLEGRAVWYGGQSDNERLEFCVHLLNNPKDLNSPWNTVPWDTDLSAPLTTQAKTSPSPTPNPAAK
jgi:ankyrin repeat protein